VGSPLLGDAQLIGMNIIVLVGFGSCQIIQFTKNKENKYAN